MALIPDSIERYTGNLGIAIYKYAVGLWHEAVNAAFDTLDTAIGADRKRLTSAESRLDNAEQYLQAHSDFDPGVPALEHLGLTGAASATTDGIDALFISPETVYRTFPQLRYRRSGVRTFTDGYGKLRTADYATGTADASSTPWQLVDLTKSWTLGYWAYAMIYIVSGTGAGQYRWCLANSATALMPDRPFDAIDNTSVYEVMQLPVSWGWHSAGAGTNYVTNNTMVGASAGAPGTPPTGWTVPSPVNGLSREIVGTGTDGEIDYIDIRYSGTATSDISVNIDFGAIAAATGETWTQATYVALAAGSLSGVTLKIRSDETDSGGTPVVYNASEIVLTSDPLGDQRFVYTVTLTGATTAFLRPRIQISCANGTTIDVTLRIGLPQAEKWDRASPPIKTAGTSETRARDQISFELHGVVYNSLSVLVDYEYDGFLDVYTGPFTSDNATTGVGGLNLYTHSSAGEDHTQYGAGGAYTDLGLSSAGTRYRDVMTYDNETGVVIAYRDGVQVDTITAVSPMMIGETATGRLMARSNGNSALPGRLYRFRLIPGALTAAQARIW